MQIEKLPSSESQQLAQLRSVGIHNCRQLLRASRRREQFQLVATSTKLSSETLTSLVRQAELSRIRGIGPQTLAYMSKIGLKSLAALAIEDPQTLWQRLGQVMDTPPNLAVIEHWIEQAQQQSRSE